MIKSQSRRSSSQTIGSKAGPNSRKSSEEVHEEHDELDETIGEMYRSSYFNPSTHTARLATLKLSEGDKKHKVKQSDKSKAVLDSLEKRINGYLHKQKKDELYGYKTLREWRPSPLKDLRIK